MRKQSQKSNVGRGTPDALDVSLRTAFCILNKQEMGRSTFLFTTAIPKRWFEYPPPQQPGPIEPNKASGKGTYPKTNPTLASVSPSAHVCPVFAFRPLLRFDRCPCLPGIHTYAMPVFRPALIPTWRPCFARWSYFNQCPVSTGTMPTRCSCFARRPCLPGIRISAAAPLRPAPVSIRHPYPSGVPDSSGAQARLMAT